MAGVGLVSSPVGLGRHGVAVETARDEEFLCCANEVTFTQIEKGPPAGGPFFNKRNLRLVQVHVAHCHHVVYFKRRGVVPVEVTLPAREALDEAVHMDAGLEGAGGFSISTRAGDDDHMDVLDTGGKSTGDGVQVVPEVVAPGGEDGERSGRIDQRAAVGVGGSVAREGTSVTLPLVLTAP